MNAPELKPCPFCGSPAEYGVTSDEGQRNDYDTIACTKCPATMRALLSWHDSEGEYRVVLTTAWNIRADLYDAQATEIADLRRQLAEAREVKPLEWNGKPSDFYMFADTDLGMYEIGVEYGDEWFCDFTSHKAGKPIRLSNCQDGPIVPQSDAQADYEARILSVLKGAAK